MYLALSILTAFIITFILLPVIIKVSRSIDLLDIPDSRKVHSISTPALGGIAIFTGFLLAVLVAVPLSSLAGLKYFLFGLLIIFLLGIRDDISSLRARHKLFTQIFAAFLVTYFTDLRLEGLYGIFGIDAMPEWFTLPLTVFVIVALTNAFNLIDGIDGLAASVAILVLSFFGWLFLSVGEVAYSIVCLSVVGALAAFLFYNWFPSQVFMGDTGSMVLGFVVSALAIKFINLAPDIFLHNIVSVHSSVGLCIAILILPIFDTLRVFTIRFINGRSPLDPDQNHLHHGLLKLGMNHAWATISLLSLNVVIFLVAIFLDGYLLNGELILVVLGLAIFFGVLLDIHLYLRKEDVSTSSQLPKENKLYLSKTA